MNQARPHTASLQQWMQSVITNPLGVVAGVASDEARRYVDVPLADLESVVTRSTKLSGAQRLAIYGRAYHLRLLECFRAEYPCLRKALGDDIFERFVIEYLHANPPQTYTLQELAARFPSYLDETRPDADVPADERNQWPDFAIDLAVLERAFFELYDGEGVEGQTLPNSTALRDIPAEVRDRTRLPTVVCQRLFAFRFPVQQYFRDIRELGDADYPSPGDSYVVLTRRNYVVQVDDLTEAQFGLLTGLSAGLTFGASVQQACEKTRNVPADLTANALQWLCEWAERGFFVAVELPPR